MEPRSSGVGQRGPDVAAQCQTVLDEFKKVLNDFKRTSVIHNPPREFILVKRLLEWFRNKSTNMPNTTNTGCLLSAVHGSEIYPHQINNLLESMKDENDKRCCLKVFIILLQLGKGEHIERFYQEEILDVKLPVSEMVMCEHVSKMDDLLSDGEEPEEFARKFNILQYQLLTDDLLDKEKGRVHPPTILPVCTKKAIKPNNQKIFLIEVPLECVPEEIIKRMKTDPHWKINEDGDKEFYHEFCLKVLRNKEHYDQEAIAYSALKEMPGIVQCLGHWEWQKPGDPEYHLLLEYGFLDLEDYFRDYLPPSFPHAITKFWRDLLLNVATGVNNTHNLLHMVEERTDYYYAWHGDIKPENILYCEGSWKIADPEFAMLVRQKNAKKDNNGLPTVMLRGGTEAYGPPEQATRPKPAVTQRFDIWSLGCVFSEAATWMTLGYRGVEQFRLVRKCVEGALSDELRGDDCFYRNGRVSTPVRDWHKYLRESLRAGDHVTGPLLNLIDQSMLRKSAMHRISAKELVIQLEAIIRNSEIKESEYGLPPYDVPPYFNIAFTSEHEKMIREWNEHTPRSSSRKSNRSKSTRPLNSQIPLPGGPTALEYGQPQNNDHSRMVPLPDMSQAERQYTEKSIEKPLPEPNQRPSLVSTESEDSTRFNYWDALKLLESQGWVSTGALERPSESRDVSSPTAITPLPNSPAGDTRKTLIMHTATSQPPQQPRRLTSIFSHLRKRSSKSECIPTGDIQHGMPSGSGEHRTDNGVLIDKVDTKYKQSDFDDYFIDRDIVFLLDNGPTMVEHWHMARELVAVLTALLYEQDDNGMDIYFTSKREKIGTFGEPKDFVNAINQNRPRIDKKYDIRDTLSQILDLIGGATYKRKTTLIILTDGRWEGIRRKRTVADTITNKIQMWGDRDLMKDLVDNRGLSIQFIQFGDDKAATVEFDYLDNHLADSEGNRLPDIIDVERATGNIKKMILGSLSSTWDDGGPSNDSPNLGRSGMLTRFEPPLELVSSPSEMQWSQSSLDRLEGATEHYQTPSRQRNGSSTGKDPHVSNSQSMSPGQNILARSSFTPTRNTNRQEFYPQQRQGFRELSDSVFYTKR